MLLNFDEMHRYFIKTPWWLKKVFPSFIWNFPVHEPAVYLTFDDGPHPEITPWVLNQLKKYNAKATFFCIGKNVNAYPDVFKMIKDEGHAIGNHTNNHLNAWNSPAHLYEKDIIDAAAVIESNLFRPPYGRILYKNIAGVKRALGKQMRIIMWDVLSADFDRSFSKEQCLQNVLKNTVAGSVIVFHDSTKAYDNLSYALPLVLKYFKEKGYELRKISHA